LLLGAFVLAHALQATGLTVRLFVRVARAARSVTMLFYLLTAALLFTALLIPSITVRAALLLPIYQGIATALRDEKLTRALALMFPVNIMLTAVTSLLGTSAYLLITREGICTRRHHRGDRQCGESATGQMLAIWGQRR
jgi:di/tricarboxylate transporter